MASFPVTEVIELIGLGPFQWRILSIVGTFWLADAVEVMLLSLLTPVLKCQWHISRVQAASLSTTVFMGQTLASPLWGIMGDRFGRKTVVILTSSFLFIFGLLSSLAPGIVHLLVLRFIVGAYIGALPQACVINSEFTPISCRAKTFLVLAMFWAGGCVLAVLVGWLLIPVHQHLGWRLYLISCSLPPLLVVMMHRWLPESPLYLIQANRPDRAKDILDRAAKFNGKDLGDWVLTPIIKADSDKRTSQASGVYNGNKEESGKENTLEPAESDKANLDEDNKDEEKSHGSVNSDTRGNVLLLLSSEYRNTTIKVWFILFTGALSYYGIILMSGDIITGGICSGDFSTDEENSTCSVDSCNGPMKTSEYLELLWTTLAEFPGNFLMFVLADRIGRRKTMSALLFTFSVTVTMACICALGNVTQVVFLFICRGSAAAQFNLILMYMSEVYPTNIRSTGIGVGNMMCRVGAMLTPYVAQAELGTCVLTHRSHLAAAAVYSVMGLLAACLAYVLPLETAGRSLR